MPTMSLEEWRKDQGLSVTALADKLGLSISYTWEIINTPKTPSIDIQLSVEKATKGAVVMDDLRRAREGVK